MTYLIPVYPPADSEGGLPQGALEEAPQLGDLTIGRFKGASAIWTGSVEVGPIATMVVGANTGRRTVTIQNLGANDIYIGNAQVTGSTGYKMAANSERTWEVAGEIFAITLGTTENVRFLQEVDE